MQHDDTSEHPEPARWRTALPSAFDLGLGSLAGSAWSLMIVLGVPGTGALNDFLLGATYLIAYALFWTLASRLTRAAAALVLAAWRPAASTRHQQRALAAVVALLPATQVLLRNDLPSPRRRWLVAAVGLGLVAVCLWVAARRAVPGGPSRWGSRLARAAAPLTLLGLALVPALRPGGGGSVLSLEPSAATGATPGKVTLIAMDGVDPRVLRRRIGEGRLPHFQRLIAEGTSGELETVSPHSPVVWTSLATGLPLSEHGVRRYTSAWLGETSVLVPADRRDFLGRALDRVLHYKTIGPVSSYDRRARAVWDVLTDLERESLVINWWATYPAVPVHGIMISNLAIPWQGFDAEELARLAQQQGLVHPPELQSAIVELIGEFTHRRGIEGLGRVAGTPSVDYFHARDDVVFELLERFSSPTQALATAYVQGIDTSSHAYTSVVFGENIDLARPSRLPEEEARALWETLVGSAYDRMDAHLGRLLENLDEHESLVVVSDHGWDYDGTSHWNMPSGVFLAFGGPFEVGAVLERCHVYDVLPTLAYALGAPLSRELEGRILSAALTGTFEAAGSPRYVASYGPRDRAVEFSGTGRARSTGASDEAHLERLRELGYIE